MLNGPSVIRTWSGSQWEIVLEQAVLIIKSAEKVVQIPCDGTIELETKRRWFRWHLFAQNELPLHLKGISKIEARLIALSYELSPSRIWSIKLQNILKEHQEQQRWIPQEVIEDLIERLIGLLIEVVKEQQKEIDYLKSKIN